MTHLSRRVGQILVVATLGCVSAFAEELRSETLRAWVAYVELTEQRIAEELESKEGFLVMDFLPPADASRAREVMLSGDVFVLKMETRNEEGRRIGVPDGMIHHWYGSIFVPGAALEDVIAWVQNYARHSDYFDEVVESRLLSREEDVFSVFLKLRRKKVITVQYNTEHLVVYAGHGPTRASSKSEATRIAELEDAGTPREREKPYGQDRGFLWKLNSYWRFKELPDGVVVECESVSLSRGIPSGLAWMLRTYVESVPRESLEKALLPIKRSLSRTTSNGKDGG